MMKIAVTYVKTTKWYGKTSISLERHVNNARKAYIDMESAAKHITFQLPDGRTRVQNLLDSTEECKDPKFLAQWSSVSDVARGMNTYFEAAADLFIPSDPVSKKSTRKRGAQI